MHAQEEHSYRIIEVNAEEEKQKFTKAWHDSWLEEGYAHTSDNIQEKYAVYDLFSVDYMLLNSESEVIGTMRIIKRNDTVGLPVLNDFCLTRSFSGSENLCEATLLTVRKADRYKDSLPTFLLLSQLWRHVRENNISGIVIAADIRLWYLLKQKFCLCFSEIGQQLIYEGSLTVPGYLNVSEQKQQALKTPPRNLLEAAFHEF